MEGQAVVSSALLFVLAPLERRVDRGSSSLRVWLVCSFSAKGRLRGFGHSQRCEFVFTPGSGGSRAETLPLALGRSTIDQQPEPRGRPKSPSPSNIHSDAGSPG